MAVAAFFCVFIGCCPGFLYRLLPHPEEAMKYVPYTNYHVSETLLILLFTGVCFFIFVKKLEPEAKISLDMDWFYRKGGRAFRWLACKPIQTVDTFVGELYRVAGLVPLMITARLAGLFDNEVIDGAVDGVASVVRGIGRRLRQAQRGQVQENLAFAFAAAAVLLIVFIFFAHKS
jgi:multicomponent Na+:H+ antiporter subunit D